MRMSPFEITAEKLLRELNGIDEDVLTLLEKFGVTTTRKVMETPLSMLMTFGLKPSVVRSIKSVISLDDSRFNYTPEFDLSEIPELGENILSMLRSQGVTIEVIMHSSINELTSSYGISRQIAEYIQNYVRSTLKGEDFLSALDLLYDRQSRATITTGCDRLDDITFLSELGSGGIRTSETTEFFGAPRTGKTQFCLQLCVTVQLPNELGGLNKKSLFIDTEGTFTPSRLIQIAKGIKEKYGWEKDIRKILEDVYYVKVSHSDEQMAVAKQLFTKLKDDVGLVVIDSISSLFRAEFSQSNLISRQQKLNEHLNSLYRLAVSKDLAVVVSNQVMTSPQQVLGDVVRAVGGNIIGHWAQTRFFLSSTGQAKTIKIFDSPALPELQTTYQITHNGIE